MTVPLTIALFPASAPEAPEAPESNDSLLLRRVQRGDRDAFEPLYRRLAGRVYGVALRLCRQPAEAEELTQEAFVRAWQHRAEFASGDHLYNWLRRVTVNLWLSQRQDAKHWAQAPDEGLDEWPPGSEPAQTPAAPGLRLDLERALRELPERLRVVCLLFDVYGWRHREIAQELGITEMTSKIHLHRARRRLREVLK